MSFTTTSCENATDLPQTENSPISATISFQPFPTFFRPSVSTTSKQTLCSRSSCAETSEASTFPSDLQNEVAKENIFKFVTSWRRAVLEDKPVIEELEKMTGNLSRVLFKKNSLDELIDNSFFSIVQLNARDEVIAFTAFNPYPDITCLYASWTEWIERHYRIKNVNARNVLFIHYMVWEPQRENEFLHYLLQISFTEFIHLKQIIILKPPKARIPNFCTKYFVPVFPFGMENYELDSVQLLLICLRPTIIPPFTARNIFQEDLEKVKIAASRIRTPVSKEQENYINEIKNITEFSQGDDKKILICKKNEDLVGMMVLNLTVDLEVLNKEFELVPFNGLKKKTSHDEHIMDHWSAARISSLKNRDRPGILLSSEFFFDQIDWELSSEKSSDRNSVRDSTISRSFSLDTNFWQFSCMQSLSNIELPGSVSNWTDSDKYKSSSPSTKDYKLPFQTAFCKMTHFFSPIFDGPLNCFAIDFLLADPHKVDEKLVCLDLLKAAFETVGDKEYCLLIIPSQFLPDRLQEFFIRVTPKLPSNTKLQLYLCHKDTLPEVEVFVKNMEENDLFCIHNFLKHIDDGGAIYEEITKTSFEEESMFKMFLLYANEQLVGLSVIDCRDYHKHFYDLYDIARHVPDVNIFENKLLLRHLIVQPTYHCHTRFFVHQIMKLSSVTCLYYALNFPNQDYYTLVTVLGEFSPVKPRKTLPCDKSYLITKESQSCQSPFSLYFLTEKSCTRNKIHVNIFIVVVGASRTALAFLENLISGPGSVHVQYNNLICVTPHALESLQTQGSEIMDFMFPIRDEISSSHAFILFLKTYVSFVYGAMTAINRAEKYIVVNNKTVIRYDYLILTCGAQYFMPVPIAKQSKRKKCQRHHQSFLSRFLVNSKGDKEIKCYKKPSNMFLINTNWDAKNALRTLQNLINKSKKTEKKIIVYGHNINVFLTIHTLMKLGIPGEVIVFVEPFAADNGEVTIFNDYYVDQAVLDSLDKSKVNYYTRYFLYDWYTEDDRITSIIFHSKTRQLEVPCLAFFPFDQKMVSGTSQRACLDAGLIFDGRLVINHNFKTNDNYIYAAGPFTKYARKYYAGDKDHRFYNSREVGAKLAKIIKCLVDPFAHGSLEKESILVPQLKEPIMYHCQLPGDFNFFVMRKPGKEVDLETAYNLKDYGDVLYTGDCEMKNGFGYFRLHLSPEGFVESITCYTKDKIDYVNLTNLYGLHETLLNNLLCRYDLSLISNFFEYFQQPWARALFHEDFKHLRELNVKALKKKQRDGTSIIEKANEIIKLNDWRPLSSSSIHLLEKQFENSSAKKEIEENLLMFLEHFCDDLPVYATRKTIHIKESTPNN